MSEIDSESVNYSWRVVGDFYGEERVYSSWLGTRREAEEWIARNTAGGRVFSLQERIVKTTIINRAGLPPVDGRTPGEDMINATILQTDERIYRYSVPVDDQWHEIALQGIPLAVDCRDSRVVEFWTRHVEDDGYETSSWYRVVGTGQPLPLGPDGTPCDLVYRGTALSPAMPPFANRGDLVWHLVEAR